MNGLGKGKSPLRGAQSGRPPDPGRLAVLLAIGAVLVLAPVAAEFVTLR